MRARHIIKRHIVPYYAEKTFDWSDTSKWINDQNAINYWLTYVKPTRDNLGPEDFTTKIY